MQLLPRILAKILAAMALLVSPALKADVFSLHIGFDGYSGNAGYNCNYWPGSYWYRPVYYFPVFYGLHYPFYYIYYPTYYCPRYYYSRFYYPPVFQFYYSNYYPWYYYPGYAYPHYGHRHYRNYYTHSPHRHHKLHKQQRTRLQHADGQKHTRSYSLYSGARTHGITSRNSPSSSRKWGGFATNISPGRDSGITSINRKINTIYTKQNNTAAVGAPSSAPRSIKIINGGSRTTTQKFATTRPGSRSTITFSNNPPSARSIAKADQRRPSVSQPYTGTRTANRQIPAKQTSKGFAFATPRPTQVIQQNGATDQHRHFSPRGYAKPDNQQQGGQARRGTATPATGKFASANQRQSPAMQQNHRATGTEKQASPRAQGNRNNRSQGGQTQGGRYRRP